MFEKPPIDDAVLVAAIHQAYGIAISELTFLPLGADSFAAVYRATSDEAAYFLKLRRGAMNAASVLVPRFLADNGVANIVAPLATLEGQPWARLEPYTLTLYPFLEGETAMKRGMLPQQWTALGAALRRVHTLTPPPELAAQLRSERFWSDQIDLVTAVSKVLASDESADPLRAELAAFWREKAPLIDAIVARARTLSDELKGRALPLVLCHADIHSANVLVSRDDQPWIVDWDEVTLAPKERDLMFVTGNGISTWLFPPGSEAHFYTGYGPAELDAAALAYYRCAWAAQDIGEYGAQVVLRTDVGEITRREALHRLRGLFEAGEIVETAVGRR